MKDFVLIILMTTAFAAFVGGLIYIIIGDIREKIRRAYEQGREDGRNGKGMTLDEAIEHCEEVASKGCDECASNHQQLAEWLKELKELRK